MPKTNVMLYNEAMEFLTNDGTMPTQECRRFIAAQLQADYNQDRLISVSETQNAGAAE